ncbi:MAG: homoserine dehydrogenase [Chloroflexi bacterium]|nr:homoserine dehydrogenase [Chloroflexota bacterium]
MNIALIGLGVVNQGLLEILRDKGESLKKDYGFEPRIVAAATRTRGCVVAPDGVAIAPDWLLKARDLRSEGQALGYETDWDSLRIARSSSADVVVEATPTDLKTAQPALDHCLSAIAGGKHLVLANKGPIALAYDELRQAAKQAGVLLRFEATVMAGTPSLRLGMQALAGCTIRSARGILNGTTNYMLTQMEAGQPYDAVLAEAQRLGYAEADPTADVDGWDAAGKAIILAAALFNKTLTLDQMQVSGIRSISPADIEAARAAGERWKLIAEVTPEGGTVAPVRIPVSHPLAGVAGTTNAVTFNTDLMGDITLIGAGAGRLQTGFALLSDLIDIHRQRMPI